MFSRIVLKRGGKTEGESPFWISFSDLMSALMVLFLVVMAVTLIAVTKKLTAEEKASMQRKQDIEVILKLLKKDAPKDSVTMDGENLKINLGRIVQFDSGSATISPEAARYLRNYIPNLLSANNTPEGQKWMRRIVVEGYTDSDGTYLFNLGLSQERSRSVVCELFAKPLAGETALTERQLRQVQDLFLVGGYSFNTSVVSNKADARIVELKVEFWGLNEVKPPKNEQLAIKEFGRC
jgi:outer membrane protein OmpA-like peptidoglycan-associated protein